MAFSGFMQPNIFTNVFYFYTNFISSTPLLLMVQTKAQPHSTTILREPGSPKRDVLNGKEGRKEVSLPKDTGKVG